MTWSKRTNPAGEQRGFPKTRRSRDQDHAAVETSIEQGQETRANNNLMGGGWGKELGCKESVRREVRDGLGFGRMAL
jgi:hypothetical protein